MTDLSHMAVLVTSTSYGRNDPLLKSDLESAVGRVEYNTLGRPLSADDLVEVIGEYDGYIAGLDEINRDVIASAGKLKVIARYGVGVDRVDLEAAREHGIVVTNTPGANSSSVAELAIGLMLALARHIPTAVEQTRQGEWPRLRGVAIEGKTIGILGLGAIGGEVAWRIKAFTGDVIGFDPFVTAQAAEQLGVALVPQEELIGRADFLTLHVPVLDETRGMVNAAFLDAMKDGAFLINTSRGELIDEAALVEALQGGKLSGVALDAFRQEPPDADNPLLALPNVIATPHTGAHTDEATNKMGRMALDECLAVLRGEQPSWPVNA